MIFSPLRYPGGKAQIVPIIKELIISKKINGGNFIEPFAGGAGVALELLFKGVVNNIILNDYNKGIYSFWQAILTDTKKFINKIETISLTMEEWNNQKKIYLKSDDKYSFDLGFATFYLNRTNISGIIKAGCIGGKFQNGKYKLDARFNKKNLIKRIQEIEKRKQQILVYNEDIENFVKNIFKYTDKTFVYFDPPYFNMGKKVYENFFNYNDHVRLEKVVRDIKCQWIMSYDDAEEIRNIYKSYPMQVVNLNYKINKKRKANELLIFSKGQVI